MKTEKKSITAIIFYVFAVLFLAYTAFSTFTAYEYVSGYVEQGSISYSTDLKDIIALYVQQAGPYLVYSLTLYGLGYIIDIATKIKASIDVKSIKEDSVTFTASTPVVKETKKEVKETPKKEEVKEAPKKESAKKEEPKKEATKVEVVKKETKPKEKKPAKAKAKKEDKPAVETKEEVKEEAK